MTLKEFALLWLDTILIFLKWIIVAVIALAVIIGLVMLGLNYPVFSIILLALLFSIFVTLIRIKTDEN